MKDMGYSWIFKSIWYRLDWRKPSYSEVNSWLKNQLLIYYSYDMKRLPKFKNKNRDKLVLEILTWVKKNIKYKRDIDRFKTGEKWQTWDETLMFGTGDCLSWDTKVLDSCNQLINIEDVDVGDFIVGKDGECVRLINKWDKGVLPIKKILLNNGSEIKATDEHKFVLSNGQEILCKDLKIGDKLLQINSIFDGVDEPIDNDYWYLKGLYIADGWLDNEHQSVCISGKDGFTKESQKDWVKTYCEQNNLKYYWHKRYIRINDRDLYGDFKDLGSHAINKRIGRVPFNKDNCLSLLNGLKADGHINKSGTCTIGTISEQLKNEIRVLCRKLGFSVHTRLWQPTKTQFGKNPIWRIILRERKEVPVKVIGIVDYGEEQVYDVEVDGNLFYLPENDVLVHNCEDQAILLYAICWYHKVNPLSMRIVTGTVNGGGGHCWFEYQADETGEWYIYDPTYYTDFRDVPLRKSFFTSKRYKSIWWKVTVLL